MKKHLMIISSALFLTFSGCRNQPLSNQTDNTTSEQKFYEDEDYQYNQPENAGSYQLLDEAQSNSDKHFKNIVTKSPAYSDVYTTWSSLIEAMSGYLIDVTYGEPYYSMMPLQFNNDIRQWHEGVIPFTDTDYEIICGNKTHIAQLPEKMTIGDMDSILGQYIPRQPDSAASKWNNTRVAFSAWVASRAAFAETLTPEKRKAFEENTNAWADYFFKEIRGLQQTRNDNVIYDAGQ